MKKYILFILFLSLSCSKGSKKGETSKKKLPKAEVSKRISYEEQMCLSGIEVAKTLIQKGELKYIIGIPLSSNLNKCSEIQEELKKKGIKVDFYMPTCGYKNTCYEISMNSEFLKTKGQSTIDIIEKAFEKVGVKTYVVKKTAYNSG